MTIENRRGFGVVLDPVQFAAELASLKQRPQYDGRALYVSLPDTVVRVFESPFVPRGQGVALSQGKALPTAIVSVQAGATQIVCIVPLANDEARAWLLEAVDQRCFQIAVNIDERSQLVVMQVQDAAHDLAGPSWTVMRERACSSAGRRDPAAEVRDILEVVGLVEGDTESLVPGIKVEQRWLFVCVPYHEEGAERAGGRVPAARGKTAVALH